VNRVRALGFLAGALAFVALAVPASAFAGTYTWDLASDFTATAPGANPDHDPYGGAPWSYEGGSSTSTTPSTFSLLPNFAISGSLATWSNSTTGVVVGDNSGTTAVVDGTATIQPGIFVEPGTAGQVAAVGWTSPFSETQTVSIDASISADVPSTPACIYGTTWTIEDNGTVLISGSLSSLSLSASPSLSASVAAGSAIDVTVANAPAETCDVTALTLQIEATGTAPAPSVTTPGPGSSTTLTSPTFSGAAGSDFGDGSQVALSVYSGPAASGSPVRTVTVARSGAAWSAGIGSALPLGTYTAQVEQTDIVGDVGLSAPVTFTVRVPSISLASLGSTPQTTSTPTFTGTGDVSSGTDPFAVVAVYAGTAATGAAVQTLTAPVTASGQFSVPVSPALADGTYTAVAAQGDASGNTGFSAPQTFSIDTHAPSVTLVNPKKGLRADVLKLAFTGAAGDESFDSHVVTVTLFKGKKASGKRLGTMQGKVTGSTWSATWTKTLAPAVYTAVASQTDAIGHVGTSVAHTFTVLALPPVIGKVATINRAGRASVKITCNEAAGDTCTGTVAVLTRGEFQPVAGGPVGRLTVLFAYIRVLGGQTSTITRTVLTPVLDALRGHANVGVSISANLRPAKGKAIHVTAQDALRRVGS
jgi:Bacterial Ig-like domain